MKAAKAQHPANGSLLSDPARAIRRGGLSRMHGSQSRRAGTARSREVVSGIPARVGARADSRISSHVAIGNAMSHENNLPPIFSAALAGARMGFLARTTGHENQQ